MPFKYFQEKPDAVYRLIDDDFQVDCSFKTMKLYSAVAPEAIIINEYSARNLNAVANLARYYWGLYGSKWSSQNNIHALERYCVKLDVYMPELRYRSRYYPCLLNHLRQLSFGGTLKQPNPHQISQY